MGATFEVPPGFDEASKEQRIAFVQELWDLIAQDPGCVPIPREHQQLLDKRLNEYRTAPHPGRLWSEVREQVLAELRKT